jgi:chromosome segregation ATPase
VALLNIEERLDALDKTNELLFEQNNDTGADLDALAESVDVIANKTADKFGEVVGAMNKNFETLTGNVDYLNDLVISHNDELLILRVLVAVFGVLLVFLLSRV